MRPSRWFRLLALIAAIGLFFAACSTDDGDDDAGSGDGGDTDSEESAATCQGSAGDSPSAEEVGGGEADGAGMRIGMVLDIGGVDDDSFNEAANAGLEAAESDFGVEVNLLEPNEDGSNRGDLLRGLAEEDYDLVIGVGFAFAESMSEIVPEFPEVQFAIIDETEENIGFDNLTNLVFAAEEGSFLVGAAAALASETGQVGFIGGVNIGLIQTFQAGFEAGVAQVDPDAEVQVNYLSEPPDFAGFADPASATTVADGMYSDGIDVVYHAAGGSGAGLFQSAEANDRLAIGVDSDQYQQVSETQQPCILTSMLKRVDQAVYDAILDTVNGELESGDQVFDLESGGIGYALDGGQLDEFEDELEDLQQQIIDGDIEVPTAP